jgi:ABC-type Mn2+/Zn2+ transport system permease subunit
MGRTPITSVACAAEHDDWVIWVFGYLLVGAALATGLACWEPIALACVAEAAPTYQGVNGRIWQFTITCLFSRP